MNVGPDTVTPLESAKAFMDGAEEEPEDVLTSLPVLRVSHPAMASQVARELAKRFLHGKKAMKKEAVDGIWKACKKVEAFGLARRVLGRRVRGWSQIIDEHYPTEPSELALRQQYALCTSKDPDLSASMRHDWALKILNPSDQQRKHESDEAYAETQGIAGGILKRRWEWDGSRSSLERSLHHYRLGMPADPKADNGYCAVNCAFLKDLLADLMRDGAAAEHYRLEADQIRAQVVHSLEGVDNAWARASLAEAYLGLGQLERAAQTLEKYVSGGCEAWELETTLRQQVRLAHIREIADAELKPVLERALGSHADATRRAMLQSILIGRVGLGLSGGGFRASLYHLGVLARLAESDVLRHVEVLSCVSGGSIVGAHYYLRLREALEAEGEALTRDAYVKVVERVIAEFVRGVEHNVRTRVLTSFGNAYAIVSGDDKKYADAVSRALHAAFYEGAVDSDTRLDQLLVQPKGSASDFQPSRHNWQLKNKVPVLVLNAATLNTGHSWQFTARSMGESPFSLHAAVDSNARLRRPNYNHEIPDRSVRLRDAVAASACVPGLFAPLQLDHLYDGYKVRLVDGGVFDNQGAASLLEQDCQLLLVSDAAGQLFTESESDGGHVSPLLRSVSIFQERIRQSGYESLVRRQQAGQLRGLAYTHLTQGLRPWPINWKNCEDPLHADDQLPDDVGDLAGTGYGIDKDLQRALAHIRTDLDVFSGVECAALMASGYKAMDAQLDRLAITVPALAGKRIVNKWFFSDVVPVMSGQDKNPEAYRRLKKHLEAARLPIGRSALLSRVVMVVCILLVVAAATAIGVLAWRYRDYPIGTVGGLAVAVALGLLGVLLPFVRSEWFRSLVDPRRLYEIPGRRAFSALALFAFGNAVVRFVDPGYLKRGRIEALFQK